MKIFAFVVIAFIIYIVKQTTFKRKILFLFVFIIFCGCHVNSKETSNKKGPLGLSNGQYWNNPTTLFDSITEDRMMSSIDGFVIDAPEKVFLDKNATVPLICLQTAETNKFVRHSLETTTQLVTVCLETGKVNVKKLAPSPATQDLRQHPPGFSCGTLALDVRGNVSEGRYSFFLLSGPEQSNQCIVEIIPGCDSKLIEEYKNRIHEIHNFGAETAYMYDYSPIKLQNLPLTTDTLPILLKWQKNSGNEVEISVAFKIEGLPRFVFDKVKKVAADGQTVYAAVPVGFIGFDENRSFVLNKETMLPVITTPGGTEDSPLLSGNVLIQLSALLPYLIPKKLSLWCVCMEHVAYLEIDL